MSSANDPDTTIQLHVGHTSTHQDWTPCPAPNDDYAFHFEGGNYDSNGGFSFQHGANSSVKWIKFQLAGFGRDPLPANTTCALYDITATTQTQLEPANPQQLQVMSGRGANSGPKFQVIKDLNQVAANGEITITVRDTRDGGSAGIVCDPLWQNS